MKSREDDLILAYLEYLEINRGRSRLTIDSYYRQLKRLNEYLESKGLSLQQATCDELEHFTGRHLHDLGIAPRSRRQAIAAVRGLYSFMVRSNVLQINPAVNVRYPSTGRRIGAILPLKDLEQLVMAIDLNEFLGIRDAALILMLAGTGVRISGLIRLNFSDLIFSRDESGAEIASVRVTEKGDNQRLVPVPDDARLALRAYLGHDYFEQIDCTLPDGDLVLFVNIRNPRLPDHENVGEARRLTRGGVARMLRRRGKAAGVDGRMCHPHALRHLYGTELLESGVDTSIIGNLMGHVDPASTKRYLHLAERLRREAVAKGSPLAKIKTPFSDPG